MKPRTIFNLLKEGQVPVMIALERLLKPVYRAAFVSAAASGGVLEALASGPLSVDALADRLAVPAESAQMFRAWLDLGVRLGELEKGPRGYALEGWWSKKLSDPKYDVAAAALEEVMRYHLDVIVGVPQMIKEGRKLSLDDQDGELIARSTRILEHFVHEAVDMVVPSAGAMRVLEVGCGEGAHLRYAAERNPDLTGVAIDLQPDVAEVASANLSAWGLSERFKVLSGDVRAADVGGDFDLVTLHNLIYYFPFEERVRFLEQIRARLSPNGRVLLTTGCLGGNLGLDVISLWFSASDSGGRFPTPAEMSGQLEAAGFSSTTRTNLMPGDSYYAFVANNGAA